MFQQGDDVNFLVALIVPPAAILGCMRPISAVVALLLCMTIAGWPIASWWAINCVRERNQDKRFRALGWDVRRSRNG